MGIAFKARHGFRPRTGAPRLVSEIANGYGLGRRNHVRARPPQLLDRPLPPKPVRAHHEHVCARAFGLAAYAGDGAQLVCQLLFHADFQAGGARSRPFALPVVPTFLLRSSQGAGTRRLQSLLGEAGSRGSVLVLSEGPASSALPHQLGVSRTEAFPTVRMLP